MVAAWKELSKASRRIQKVCQGYSVTERRFRGQLGIAG
jgi:hypothetical protein